MTKRTVLSVLQGTYDKDKFVSQLKEKGIDTVLRYTCLLYTSLPGKVATDTRYEKLSTDRSDCRLSFASSLLSISTYWL